MKFQKLRPMFVARLAILLVAVASTFLASSAIAQRRAPRTHVVVAGDNLGSLARRYSTSADAIQVANNLRSPDQIRVGQELIIPRASEDPSRLARSAPRMSAAQRRAAARATGLGLGNVRAASTMLARPLEARWVRAAGRNRLTGTLLTPVRGGNFVRGWGSGAGGYHLAMDIHARTGTRVRASEAGIVGYSGDGVRGYGNMILIIHPNGWVTGYAHNQRNLVVAGETVTRGQTIGRVGSTGTSHGPHVHYMLVVRGQHCDMAPLLRPRMGPRVRQVAWTGERPDSIRCLPRSARPHPSHLRPETGASEEEHLDEPAALVEEEASTPGAPSDSASAAPDSAEEPDTAAEPAQAATAELP